MEAIRVTICLSRPLELSLSSDLFIVRGLQHVTVWITSQIGRPISSPQSVVVEVIPANGMDLAAVRPQIQREVQLAFTHMKFFCKALTRGSYGVC